MIQPRGRGVLDAPVKPGMTARFWGASLSLHQHSRLSLEARHPGTCQLASKTHVPTKDANSPCSIVIGFRPNPV